MKSRRQFLTALALGGIGVSAATASATRGRSVRAEGTTELTVRGTPSVVGLTGLPDAVAPRVTAVNRRYHSLSIADVDDVSATVQLTGQNVHAGVGTAYGSFDAERTAREIARKTDFERVTDTTAAEQEGFGLASTDTAGHAHDRSPGTILVRAQPAAVVVLDGGRIDVCRGVPPADAAKQLEESRAQSTTAVSGDGGAPGLGSILGGDVVAHATIGTQARERLRAALPGPEGPLETVVDGVRAAGIGTAVGSETSALRYALEVADARTQRAAKAVIEQFAADGAVDVRDRYVQSGTVVVDATVETPAVWPVHERLIEG